MSAPKATILDAIEEATALDLVVAGLVALTMGLLVGFFSGPIDGCITAMWTLFAILPLATSLGVDRAAVVVLGINVLASQWAGARDNHGSIVLTECVIPEDTDAEAPTSPAP